MPPLHAAGILVLFALCHLILAGLSYRRTRGTRTVCCPVTHTPATVSLDALRGALLLTRPEEITVKRCSLWPEHRECYQWCRSDIEDAAAGSRSGK